MLIKALSFLAVIIVTILVVIAGFILACLIKVILDYFSKNSK